MYTQSTTSLFINRGFRPLPPRSCLLNEVKIFESTFQLYRNTESKRLSLNSLKQTTQFITRMLDKLYTLNEPLTQIFSSSLLFYRQLLSDPNSSQTTTNLLLQYLKERYTFTQSPQYMGLLIGILVVMRLQTPEMHKQLSNVIQKVYLFAQKDRTYCDFSQLLYFKTTDIIAQWIAHQHQKSPTLTTYTGWQQFLQLQASFEDFCETTQTHFKTIFHELKLNEEKHQHELASLIHKLIDISGQSPSQQTVNLFAFLFLLKYLLSQHKYTENKLSDIMIKTIKKAMGKLVYIPLNVQFHHMNWFLVMFKVIIKEKQVFGQVRTKLQLAIMVAQIFFADNKNLIGANKVEEFCQKLTHEPIFNQSRIQLTDSFSHIASLTLITQKPSQIFSYSSAFNQRRKASYPSLMRYLSQPSNTKPYIPEHKLSHSLTTHKSQILKYAEDKIQKQQYLQLYVSLQQIYRIFEQKLTELTGALTDDIRHEKLKDLQTWYVSAYMKILLAISSEQNPLFLEGYMSKDFIEHFFYQIISRFSELTMTDIDFEAMFTILYQQYSVLETITFDIETEKFGLRELFEVLGQRETLMGSTKCMYEIQMLRRYYNMVSNGGIEKNKKSDRKLPIQRFIDKMLERKQMAGNKKREIIQSSKKKAPLSSGNKFKHHQPDDGKQTYNKQSEAKYKGKLSSNNNGNNKNDQQQRRQSSDDQQTSSDAELDYYSSLLEQPTQQKLTQSLNPFQRQSLSFPTKLTFPTSPPIPFFFIKSETLNLLDTYLTYFPLQPMTDRKLYYDIFSCLVMVIDNEQLLMDIYANVVFTLLGSRKEELVRKTYDDLAMVRKLHSDKYAHTFKHTHFARKSIICIFEQLRKIQLKRQKLKSKPYTSSSSTTNQFAHKQKYTKSLQPEPQNQNKVYKNYFQHLFNSTFEEILIYGRQLFGIRKFRDCIFVLQVAREEMAFLLNEVEQEMFGGQSRIQNGKEERQRIQKMILQCELLLSDCYAALVWQFRHIKQQVNNKCIFNKVSDHKYKQLLQSQNHPSNPILNHNSSPTQPFPTISTNLSLIQNLSHHINSHFQQICDRLNRSQSEQFQIDTEQIVMDEESFRSQCYGFIFQYCDKSIPAISTNEDLELFYNNMLLGGVMYAWYQQKYMGFVNSTFKQISKKHSSNLNGEFTQQELQSQIHLSQQTADLLPSQQQFPIYSQLIRSYCHSLNSIEDRLELIKLVAKVDKHTQQENLQTMRMLGHAYLDCKQQPTIFNYLQRYFNGKQKYEDIPLLDLELLQRYHFLKQDFQQVKAITRHMKNEQMNMTFGEKQCYYPNWPQVYAYDLIAKIQDLNSKQNPLLYWKDISRMIKEDKYLMIQGRKFALEDMRDQAKLGYVKKKSSKLYNKLMNQLQIKIKQYLNLLRVIFAKLQLSKNEESLSIFQIMEHIYFKIFIPNLTKQQSHVDYFLYYLRFMCEKVNLKFFHVRKINEQRRKMSQKQAIYSGQRKKQEQVKIYTQKNLVSFLIENLTYVKHHTLYMIRSMDPQPNTDKNIILRDILTKIMVKNPVQNLWTLTYLKYYEKKLPIGKNSSKKQFSRYIYPEDAEINQLHNTAIQQLYKSVSQQIDSSYYNQLISIPYAFIQWLQKTAAEKAEDPNKPGDQLYFAKYQNIQREKDDLNKKIRSLKFRIPFPFDQKFYIRSVTDVKLSIYEGKSMPCFVTFNCGLFSDLENQEKNKKGNKSNPTSQPSQSKNPIFTIQKHILLKNNFSMSDHRIETNTANFYKQIGVLDSETTYGIINLTKYILIIEKICVSHKSLRDLITESCQIDFRSVYELRENFVSSIKKDFCHAKYLYEPKWYDKSMELRKQNKLPYKGSMFYHFYLRAIDNHSNINEWWQYMTNYVRTLAYWSYVSFATKLGDRHLTNILISNQGKFIHIDYEYNFGVGLLLGYPEWVPFRLTELMVSPLGVFKEKGLFLAFFIEIAKIFNPDEQNIWKALSHFSPIQRQLIESTSQFKNITVVNSLVQKCEKVIDLAMDDSLLRLMFAGWNADL